MGAFRVLTFVIVLASAAAAPRASFAQPADPQVARARSLFAEGDAALRAEKWAVAIDRFEQVRAIKETPGVVFHLAAAHEGARHLAEALGLFERARELASAAGVNDVLALADQRIAALGHRVPRLVVRAPRADATRDVRVDGAPLAAGRQGDTLRLDPGPHRVEATMDGTPFVRELSLAEGAHLTVVLGESPPVPAPVPVPVPDSGPASSPPSASPSGSGPPVGPIALGAGGVVLAAAGFVTFAIAGGENSSAEEACTAGSCDPGARDTVQTLDRVALGLWIGGALALGGAAAWWVIDAGSDGSAVTASAGSRGVSLRATF